MNTNNSLVVLASLIALTNGANAQLGEVTIYTPVPVITPFMIPLMNTPIPVVETSYTQTTTPIVLTPTPVPSPTPKIIVTPEPITTETEIALVPTPYVGETEGELEPLTPPQEFDETDVTIVQPEVTVAVKTPKPVVTPEPTVLPEIPDPTPTPKKTPKPKPTEKPKPIATPKPTSTPKPVETPEPNKIVTTKWSTDYVASYRLAQKNKKKLLVYITRDACTPCKMLEEGLKSLYLGKYVCVKINSSTANFRTYFSQYDSTPTLLVINSDSRIERKLVGYENAMFPTLAEFINKH